MVDAKMDSISSKTSSLDDKFSVEESSPSCSENARCCTDDIPPLNLVGRLSVLATHSQSAEVNESSISANPNTVQVCHTPTKRKFNQSATGLNDFMFSTHNLSSYFEENAETDSIENSDAEADFSELLFNSLLELIISTKLMEMSVNNLVPDSDQAAECKTPTYLPFLTGIAKTCPPAPMRQSFSVKKFDHSICRKLDFGSSLN
ncbi:hypothetical protein KSP39_PZI010470 [Platanthera zijinensis]|uniref:Uncharacterized protein n=1 Tax=Platanthera zijinensis TaxID=2320716 RepID=A0AAP0BIB3_9ASPA